MTMFADNRKWWSLKLMARPCFSKYDLASADSWKSLKVALDSFEIFIALPTWVCVIQVKCRLLMLKRFHVLRFLFITFAKPGSFQIMSLGSSVYIPWDPSHCAFQISVWLRSWTSLSGKEFKSSVVQSATLEFCLHLISNTDFSSMRESCVL